MTPTERPRHAFYNITVKEEGLGYILFNEASGAPVGSRLYKGLDDRDPKQRWPFFGIEKWWEWEDLDAARSAATKLQIYLVAREVAKTQKRKK